MQGRQCGFWFKVLSFEGRPRLKKGAILLGCHRGVTDRWSGFNGPGRLVSMAVGIKTGYDIASEKSDFA
jgi:hypothetical protein